jgi:tetratricopeptide (TPR) repeat protein
LYKGIYSDAITGLDLIFIINFDKSFAFRTFFVYHKTGSMLSEFPKSDRSALPQKRISSLSKFALLLFLISFFAGCSFYTDITGYFNTFYNARNKFNEAVNEVRNVQQKDRDTNYFAPYIISQSTAPKFEKVIEKCSKIIQFYPTSRWVDDAILMIGQSYEYLGESESAIRKFDELLNNFPTSNLRFDARLWTAKAKYHEKLDAEALKIVKDLFPDLRAEGKSDLLLESLMLQAQIYTERKEYDQAAQAYQLAVEVPGDDAMRSFSQFQLGYCMEKMGDRDKAADAYGKVVKFSPSFPLELRGRLRSGIMLRESGHADKALKVFDKLNGERLLPDEHGFVDLEIANTYLTMGDTTTAFPIYNMIDTAYRNSEAAAKSMFQRAKYFEKETKEYRRARVYYARAKMQNPSLELVPVATRKTDDLTRYLILNDIVNRYTAAMCDDTAKGGYSSNDSIFIILPPQVPQLEAEVGSGGGYQAAGMTRGGDNYSPYGNQPGLTGSSGGGPAYQRRHMDRDLVQDDDDVAPGSDLTQNSDTTRSTKSDSLRRSTRAKPVFQSTGITLDSAGIVLTQSYYELGGLFYLELNLPDSAKFWYNRLLSEYTVSPYVPRTYFALSEVYNTNGDSLTADSLQNILIAQYPESEYGRKLRRIRGMDVAEIARDPVEIEYNKAESLLVAGKTKPALAGFKSLALRGGKHPLVKRARFAVGWIYENQLSQNDSATVWYKKILREDSTGIYAAIVKPKVAVRDNPERLKEFIKVKEPEPVVKDLKLQRTHPNVEPATPPPEEDFIQDNTAPDDTTDQSDDDEDKPAPDDDPPNKY